MPWRGEIDYAVVRILAESSDLEEAAPRLLETIGGTLDWEAGSFWDLEPETQTLSCVVTWQAPGIEIDSFDDLTRQIKLAPGVGLPGRVQDSGEPAWIADVTKDPNFPRGHSAAEAGLRAAFAFPIIDSGGSVIAVIEFFSRSVPEPDYRLIEGVRTWGIQIGQFVSRKRAEETVRESEAAKSAIIEASLDCVITMDHEGRILEFNPAAERTFGYQRANVIGKEMADLIIPPSLRERHRRGLNRYLTGREGTVLNRRLQLTGMRSDESEFPVELTVTRIGTGELPVFAGFVRDITERKGFEDALRFLAEASTVFDSSLELDETLRNVARISVPFLADACSIELLERRGSIKHVAAAATDPTVEETMRKLGSYPIDPEGPHPVAKVLRDGRMEIFAETPESLLEEVARGPEHLELLRKVPTPTGGVVAPLRARGRTLGAISFGCIGSIRKVTTVDLGLVEDVARRAATAIDNARLYNERGSIATTLQQSLLSPHLPEVPGVEIAARFRPAGEGRELGGDFYDVFDAGEAGWAIVIGDVFGKGADAAAITALARYTLRVAAMREPSLEAMLSVLNDALLWQLPAQQFCTVACAILNVTDYGARLSLAAAGHPLPLLLRTDGRVELIGAPGTLLGVFPEPNFAYQEIDLSLGDTVVFYTDGVTETRTLDGPFGERLTQTVASCAGLDAASVAQQTEEALLEAEVEEPRDDAVILVMRVRAGGEQESELDVSLAGAQPLPGGRAAGGQRP